MLRRLWNMHVYAYYNNEWHLYDPLFNNYGITDTNKMAELYFPIQVEGINMAYDGMDKKIAYNGTGIYYENDKFMFYAQGIPALEYYGTDGADWLGRVNDEIAIWQKYIVIILIHTSVVDMSI